MDAAFYEVYAPHMFAGIAGLKNTLEDRSLPLFMLRKWRTEPVVRLSSATEAEAQALSQAWRSRASRTSSSS